VPDLAQLGIHVEERSTRTVIRRETKTAVIPLRALASLLRLYDEHPNEADFVLELEVPGHPGEKMIGDPSTCLTLRLHKETMHEEEGE
jgi:hypothetical protein